MRIRKWDADGDMVFGHGLRDFHIDVPDAPAVAVDYRLNLSLGDWWLDTSAGTPWQTKIIGRGTESTRDPVIRSRILGTQGVTAIIGPLSYSSNLDRPTRALSVIAEIVTAYSKGPISVGSILGGATGG